MKQGFPLCMTSSILLKEGDTKMKKQAYQKPTIYNSDGTKAQTGTYDIRTDPLTNSTADGI